MTLAAERGPVPSARHPISVTDTVREALSRWPELAEQSPLARPRGVRMSPRAFIDFTRSPLARLRLAGYSRASSDGLIGPFEVRGTCLSPFVRSGSRVWIDRHATASDGDIVLVAWHSGHWLDMLTRASATYSGFARVYGVEVPNVVAKALRHVNGHAFLCEQLGAAPLQAGIQRLLGVVRFIEQPDSTIGAPAAAATL